MTYVSNSRSLRMICAICGGAHAHPMYSDVSKDIYRCRDCIKCRWCGRDFDYMNTKSPFCDKCVCKKCKSPKYAPPDLIEGLCYSCWYKEHPEKACKVCTSALADTYIRSIDRRSPSLCNTCTKIKLELEHQKCWFCNGRANHVYASRSEKTAYAICDVCVNVQWCGRGCKPTRPCRDCQAKNQDKDNPTGHISGDLLCVCKDCRDYRSGSFLFVNRDTKFWDAPSIKDRIHNRSSRNASVEIEVAGLRGNKKATNTKSGQSRIASLARKWQMSGIVQDESLRQGGFEINTAPAAGDILLRQIDEMCSLLKEEGAFVDKDGRCGTHVHIDVRDFDYFSLRKLLILYAIIEPALIRTQPYARVFKKDSHGNIRSHCLPCGMQYAALAQHMKSTEEIKAALGKQLYDNRFGIRPPKKDRGNNRSIASRYYFLNVHSFFHIGTVECRGHAGTVRGDKIKKWTRMWIDIVDAAYRMTEKDIMSLKGSPLDIVCSLVNKESAEYVKQRFIVFSPEYPAMERYI